MDVDAQIAAAAGFPKLKYAFVERERRWLCGELPRARLTGADAISDLYITGTRLRLREARPLDGGPVMRRLGCKADLDACTRLITSIYLTETEFALFANLPGRTLRKVRHRLAPDAGVVVAVDVFEGPLAGLILAEAEFASDAELNAFPAPDFVLREVTDDPRYGGASLALNGLPQEARA